MGEELALERDGRKIYNVAGQYIYSPHSVGYVLVDYEILLKLNEPDTKVFDVFPEDAETRRGNVLIDAEVEGQGRCFLRFLFNKYHLFKDWEYSEQKNWDKTVTKILAITTIPLRRMGDQWDLQKHELDHKRKCWACPYVDKKKKKKRKK
jgi:hypothetical protein